MGPQHADFWAEQQRKLSDAGLEKRFEYFGHHRSSRENSISSIAGFVLCSNNLHRTQGTVSFGSNRGRSALFATRSWRISRIAPPHASDCQDPAIGQLFRADSMPDLCQKMSAAIENTNRQHAVEPAILDEIDIRKHAQRVLELFARASSLRRKACVRPNYWAINASRRRLLQPMATVS